MSQLYQIVGNTNVSSSDRRNYQALREKWKKLMDSKERRCVCVWSKHDGVVCAWGLCVGGRGAGAAL